MAKLTLIQWTGDNRLAVSDVLDTFECIYSFTNDHLHIHFDDNEIEVLPSDWICESNDGHIYVLNQFDFTDKFGLI